jgi:phosphohistidine swiveling domain-containing protein
VATVRRLEQLSADDVHRFGGKAVQCGVLLQAGFAVPEGIAIAFDAADAPHLPEDVRAWLDARPSMRFAVRSSAADEDGAGSSFAGVHESVLDVGAGGVERAIAECVASMSSERARAYRAARGLDAHRGAAVLIQRMIEPRRAGVAFTADPVSGDRDTIVINEAAGRGEAVVNGSVQPEETRVRKDAARDPLAKLMLRVEEHYGAPQDVEWCDDGETIWIVQSRPITATGGAAPAPGAERPAAEAAAAPLFDDVEWTRANLREVMPDLPCPSVAETLTEMLSSTYERFYGALLDPKLGPIMRVINGRMYFNVTQFRRMARVAGESEASLLRAVGHPAEITAAEEKRQKPRLRDLLSLWRPLAHIVGHQLMLQRNVPRWAASMRAFHDECRALDVAAASDDEMLGRLNRWRETSYKWIFPAFLLGSVMTFERMLRDLCAKRGVDGDRLLQAFLGAGERSVSSEQAMDVLRLARRELGLETFLERYGHRGIYESDWSLPRLAEDPTPVLEAVRTHQTAGDIPDPDAIARRQQRAWNEFWRDARPRFGAFQRKRLEWLLQRVKWMYLWRERYRSEMVRVMAAQRVWHLELARRFIERGWIDNVDQYFALTLGDIARAPSTYREVADAKLRQRQEWAKIEMPLLLRSCGAAGFSPLAEEPGGLKPAAPQLRGLCVSVGFVEAPVAVLHHPSEVARFPRGAILVTAATDPSWTPLFTLASGVIVEIGGTLSHAATVAREMGLPALANVRDATKILKDGMIVRLDATNGYAAIV